MSIVKIENTASANGGIGFFGLLTIVFIVLKLLGKITWSWWWVLSPMWIPLAVVLGAFLIVLIIGLIVEALKK